MKLTKKKAVKLHRELWDWLYHHPDKRGCDWPEWEKNGGNIKETENDCFGCEYVTQFKGENCRLCPIVWPGGSCGKLESSFGKWHRADISKTRKQYAKQVRDLPERI